MPVRQIQQNNTGVIWSDWKSNNPVIPECFMEEWVAFPSSVFKPSAECEYQWGICLTVYQP